MTQEKQQRLEEDAKMKTFNFWKHNKKSEHFQLSESELKIKFRIWLTYQSAWINEVSESAVVADFITAPNGMSATFDKAEYESILEILAEEIHAIA